MGPMLKGAGVLSISTSTAAFSSDSSREAAARCMENCCDQLDMMCDREVVCGMAATPAEPADGSATAGLSTTESP